MLEKRDPCRESSQKSPWGPLESSSEHKQYTHTTRLHKTRQRTTTRVKKKKTTGAHMGLGDAQVPVTQIGETFFNIQ